MVERTVGDSSSSLATPYPAPVALRTLGTLRLDGASAAAGERLVAHPKRLAVLLYLALATPRGRHRRDTLVALFWPESDAPHARGSLRKAVHEIRRALGADALASHGDEALGLAPGRVWCDATAFEDAAGTGHDTDALELYRGDLLPGFFVRDAPGFEEWLERERQRLRAMAVEAAQRAAGHCEREGDAARAVAFARRAVSLAELDERPLRGLVSLLDRLGDRAAAVQAYDEHARRLASELDAEPSPETRALVARLRARGAAPVVRGAPSPSPSPSPPIARAIAPAHVAAARSRPPARRRLAFAKIAGTLAAGLLPWLADRPEPASEREPRWVVVADFDGPDDPLPLASTARNVVDAALHRSGALALVPDGELRLGKRSVGVPDTARLTLPLAREIALRGDFEVVVTGRIESPPDAYALTLRAVRADSGSVLALRSGTARSPDEFIALSRRLGREMEDELARGRHAVAASLQPTGRIWPVTNSFAAYRQFMLAQHARGATGSETAPLVPLRAAVQLDTTFAEAWMALGTVFANLGMLDSARVAYAAARRHADPADTFTMMFLDAYDAKLRHDREGTRRAWAAVIERFPWSQRATANYAVSLERLQRYDEAIAAGRFAMAKERGFHTAVTRANLARSLASLGRWDEARRALTLDGIAPEEQGQLYLELGAERWAAAERVIALQLHPGRRTETRRRAMVAAASLAALRGDVALAARVLREAARLARIDEAPASARRASRALLLLAVANGDTTLLPALPDDAGADADAGARLLRGLVAAARGDTAAAARARATLRTLSPDDTFALGIGPQLLDAWLLAHAGRLDDARRRLRPALRTHGWDDDGEQLWTLARWLSADLDARAGDSLSAARALELIVDPVEGVRVEELELRGIVLPHARQRLGRMRR